MFRVELHKVKRNGRKAHLVWMLRWWGTDGKRYGETVGDVHEVSKRDGEQRPPVEAIGIDAGSAPVDKPKTMTLGVFETWHATSRGLRCPTARCWIVIIPSPGRSACWARA